MSSSQTPGYAGDISPADAWAQVQAGEALLVDVRTPEEQKWVGRVPGAIPVPWLIDNGQRQRGRWQGRYRGRLHECLEHPGRLRGTAG